MPFLFHHKTAGFVFDLNVAGDTQVKAMLTGALRRVGDFRPLANPIDWEVRKNVEELFGGEGGSRIPWAALSPHTVADRIRHGFPGEHPILVRTGDLKKSLVKKTDSKHILEKHRDHIDIGSKVNYSIYHQTGTSKMPARKMIFLAVKNVNNIIRFMRMYVVDNRILRG